VKLRLATSAALFCVLVPRAGGDCHCHKPEKNDTTRWGGNQSIVIVPQQHFREVSGVVQLIDNDLAENALAEIFDKPEYLVSDKPWSQKPEQKRLRACVTSRDGKFCFRNLPDGAYELRVSFIQGVNVTHVYVVIDRKAAPTEPLRITLSLGT